MSIKVNIHEAKTHLSSLLSQVSSGQEVVIAKAGKPLARLVPVEVPRVTLGFMKGKIHLSDNFGDPLPDDVLDQFFGTTPETTERK